MNREDIIKLAREAGFYVDEESKQNQPNCISHTYHMIDPQLERFAELVRADERNSWPAEMEAMERQVNILTDALNDRQRWFDALEAQNKQAILAEREACAKVCDSVGICHEVSQGADLCFELATAIRARSNT